MNEKAEHKVAFNLILCLYCVGERNLCKLWYERMLGIYIPGKEEEEAKDLLLLQKKEVKFH
jgi:hypothetical protein